MINGITQNVDDRVDESLQNPPVEFDLRPLHLKNDLFTDFLCQVPHHTGKSVGNRRKRNEPHQHYF